MKIVIDIPDIGYDWIKNGFPDDEDKEFLIRAIISGTVLPKVHGALIDEDILLDKWNNLSVRGRTEFDQVIMCTPVIIPADKGMCYTCQYKTDSCQEGLHCIRDNEG